MISIKKLSTDDFKKMQINEWSVWEKEVSVFDWYYDCVEECYILNGEIEITDENNQVHKLHENDFVRFDKGLKCKWKIIKPVKKHYRFL
ncbi:MAG: cupin domain-containing protein [Candidatus Cloacimonetes bacterium]|nr:cupin domain-containing protein [Candidatus Cloacimonadota bacterium]HPM01506.1 cupin domain-containing protein [Candidatus Cloacimonadota bacterium]